MSKPLFDGSDDGGDDDLQLGTNADYAKSYNSFRKKELLKKFKDRGMDVSESGSESSSESSEDDEAIDAKFDQEFFKTLASLKSRDPAIYDKNTRFFDALNDDNAEEATAEGAEPQGKKEKRPKAVTLKDYERQIILEKGGKFVDDLDSDEEQGQQMEERAASPTLVEEERRLRSEFKDVVNAQDSEEEEEFGGIFKKRVKSRAEEEAEEQDYAQWLAGKNADIEENLKEKLEPLKDYWSRQNLPQSERFLRDYILNKGYANTNTADIPTYDEIVGDAAPLSEDEEDLEKQAEFEQKYNFRFEEPDSEFIQRFPRTIENSVRRTDDKRKQKRQDLKDRKQQEKEQKLKELEIVREMKRKEIEEKIRKLKTVTGNDELGFKDDELEEDFDPEAHDRRMGEIFNEDYYGVDEGEEKPECPSDIDELKTDDWDNYDPRSGGGGDDEDEPHCDDEDFNMDCDYDPTTAKEQLQKDLIESTRSRKSRKGRRNRFMEMIQAAKTPFNPEEERTYAEYIEEYYKMDCEDIVGDIPCRFKYVETTPNDFGLSIEEILLAKNRELNQWASLKKAIQIRPDFVEKKEQRLYKMKAKNEDLKRKIFKSLYGEESDEEEEENESKANSKEGQGTAAVDPSVAANEGATEGGAKKRRRKKRKNQEQSGTAEAATSDAAGAAKKPRIEADSVEKSAGEVKTEGAPKKNKKKNKKKAPNASKAPPKPEERIAKPNRPGKTEKPTVAEKSKPNPFGKKGAPSAQGGAATNGVLPPLRGANRSKPAGGKFTAKGSKFANRKGAPGAAKDTGGLSDERLKAYGINPRKFHKKQKFAKMQK